MILQTIQSEKAFRTLNREGILCTDQTYVEMMEYPAVRTAYLWISDQMKKKIGEHPKGVELPLWAWHTCSKNRLRESKSNNAVFLEIEIQDDQVLLTDYDLWCAVLMNCDLTITSEAEDEALSKRLKHLGFSSFQELVSLADRSSLSAEAYALREKIIKSWDECLSINKPVNLWYGSRKRSIQATFWSLKREQVKNWHLL